jgi:hypothetical protein
MDIPEELKEKSTRIMVYRMRKYNLIIMGLGTVMFLAMGFVGGVLGWSEGESIQAIAVAAAGFVLAFMLAYLALGNWVRYEVGPENIIFVPVFGTARTLNWADVTKLETNWLPNGGWEMRLSGKDSRPIRIDHSVPGIRELSVLVQLHLRAHGKHELVETFIKQTLVVK